MPFESVSDPFFVEEPDARTIAEKFLQGSGLRSGALSSIALLMDERAVRPRSSSSNDLPAYYVYNLSEGGFVIVSASKLARPVLGYSLQNSFGTENQNMRSFLEGLSSEIQAARLQAVEDPSGKDPYIGEGEVVPGMGRVVVPMLLRTRWNQDRYTGGLLPGGIAIGCLAVATGQVMKYWEYPDHSRGKYSYKDRNLGFIEHDYNYPIDWSAMPDVNNQPNRMLATFFYGLAMAMDMKFGPESGALMVTLPVALNRFYDYPKNLEVVQRGANELAQEWIPKIKAELDAGRPVLYGGQGSAGGHAFVLDGYTDQDYFHVNWGWGGLSDGWFVVDALDPDALGTGGGAGAFNRYQHYMKNFQPPLSVKGDDTTPVEDEADKHSGESVITYDPVYGLSQLQAFLGFTQFKSRQTVSGPDQYTDFTHQLIIASREEEIPFIIAPKYTGDKVPCHIRVWMDLDNDGYFADYELMAEYEGQDTFEGSFKVPAVISSGAHRIRVIMSLDGKPTAHKSVMNGEVEDYQISID